MSIPRLCDPRARRALLRSTLLTLAALLTLLPRQATAESRFDGHWEGAIEIPGTPLAFDLDLKGASEATLTGDLSIPAQSLKDMPVAGLVVTGDSIQFQLREVPGLPTFRGRLEPSGARVSGMFLQGGQTFPFHFGRGPSPVEAARLALADLEPLIASALLDFRVPGVGLVVVKDGEVLVNRGFGLRDVARKLPVTSQTLFEIGSSTKAFTVFLMGTFVDEGRLDWDAPVRTWLPKFQLHDPVATEQMTPRDLVTHRSGLPRHDLVWYNSPATREELFGRLRHLEPNKELREEFQYNNLMFMTAGYLVESIAAEGWEDLVRTRVFQPLGMTHSLFRVAEMARDPDAAVGYQEKDGAAVVIPYRDIVNVAPAGAIKSCTDDMARWLLVQLGGGTIDGRPILKPATLKQMHTPQMVLSMAAERPEFPVTTYGMGWFVQPYQGHAHVHHGGNIDGFSALVTLFPRDGLGVVVLANQSGTPVPALLTRTIADRILGLPQQDWLGDAHRKKQAAEAAARDAATRKGLTRVAGTKPSHPLEEYVGDYWNDGYGALRIERAGSGLAVVYNAITNPLEHWHYDVWNGTGAAADPVFEDTRFQFTMSTAGDINGLRVPFEPEVPEIVFVKKPDARMSDPAYLVRFVGRYRVAETPLNVALNGNRLEVSTPGQPTLLLLPTKLDQFEVEGLSGYGARFVVDPKSKTIQLRWIQPDGVYESLREGS